MIKKNLNRYGLFFVAAIMIMFFLGGCAKPVKFKPRSLTPPKMLNCVDSSGHVKKNKPFVLGGHCFCNPSYGMYKTWKKDGFFKGMKYEAVVNFYKDRGIKIVGAKKCNNCMDNDKHAALGGKCLTPPTPGTLLYEQVLSGGKVVH